MARGILTESFAEKVACEKHSKNRYEPSTTLAGCDPVVCVATTAPAVVLGFEFAPQALKIGIHFRSGFWQRNSRLFSKALLMISFNLGRARAHVPGQRRGVV